jgi:hypothetical protein
MRVIDAFHLPGLTDGEIDRWEQRTLDHGRLALRYPVLRPGAITRLAARLKEARRHALTDRPVAAVIDALATAAGRIAGEGPTRELLLDALPATTGVSAPMAAHILDGMAKDWTADALTRLVRAELGGAEPLERFVPHAAGSHTLAVGPPLICHIMAGNVPGVGVTSLIRATLVRSASIAKTAAGEPLLAPLFAQALHDMDPALAACIAVTYWPGTDDAPADEAFAAADTAVIYGGSDAIAAVRRRAPVHLTLVEHGPRISLGMVGTEALQEERTAIATAADVARAAAAFDQHGCVSPQIVYVERGAAITPSAFARLVADAFGRLAEQLPRGRLTHADAAALRALAASAEFRSDDDGAVTLLESRDATVVYDETSPLFEGTCLNRTLRIKPIDRLEDVPDLVAPFRDVLQSAALAGPSADRTNGLAVRLAAAGITRITTFARLPWPAATWHHDGRGPLLELLRFVDLETDENG